MNRDLNSNRRSDRPKRSDFDVVRTVDTSSFLKPTKRTPGPKRKPEDQLSDSMRYRRRREAEAQAARDAGVSLAPRRHNGRTYIRKPDSEVSERERAHRRRENGIDVPPVGRPPSDETIAAREHQVRVDTPGTPEHAAAELVELQQDEVRVLARKHAAHAVQTVLDVMRPHNLGSARVAAARQLLTMAYGVVPGASPAVPPGKKEQRAIDAETAGEGTEWGSDLEPPSTAMVN